MTKEELKQEVEEWLQNNNYPYSNCPNIEKKLKQAYLASAEPREKRIAELEETINKLRKQIAFKANKEIAAKQLIEAKEIIGIMGYLLFDVWGYIAFPLKERVIKFLSEVEK